MFVECAIDINVVLYKWTLKLGLLFFFLPPYGKVKLKADKHQLQQKI